MSIELYILGIRKLRKEEVKELTGKTRNEMEESTYFRQLFPSAPHDSWYRVHDTKGDNRDMARMHTPVVDANGDTVYVIWEEVLGYYWHKNPYDHERIELFLDYLDEPVNWDEEYHVVAPYYTHGFVDCRPQINDGKEEITAFLYG